MEPSPKGGSDMINVLNEGRKTQEENMSCRTVWTYVFIPVPRELDLKSSAKRGANKTKVLESLY